MRISTIIKFVTILGLFTSFSIPISTASGLQGSGASFPAPLLDGCKAGFAKTTGGAYFYSASSSGAGQANSDRSIGDFWMSDTAYTASSKRASIIHVPLVAAPIGVMYNLKLNGNLQLSATTIAGIFAGKITRWNDKAIVADNNRSTVSAVYKVDSSGKYTVFKQSKVVSNLTLPNLPIKVIYRSDSSGTTDNFTNYLHNSAPKVWPRRNSKVFSDSFPGNINSLSNLGRVVGAASSTGVSLLASSTANSITYAEVGYAKAYNLKTAKIINPAGGSVAANSAGVGLFLSSSTFKSDGSLSYDYKTLELGAYPLGVVSYLLADTLYRNKAVGLDVKKFATYILSPGCSKDIGGKLGFAVITGELQKRALAQIAKIA